MFFFFFFFFFFCFCTFTFYNIKYNKLVNFQFFFLKEDLLSFIFLLKFTGNYQEWNLYSLFMMDEIFQALSNKFCKNSKSLQIRISWFQEALEIFLYYISLNDIMIRIYIYIYIYIYKLSFAIKSNLQLDRILLLDLMSVFFGFII